MNIMKVFVENDVNFCVKCGNKDFIAFNGEA